MRSLAVIRATAVSALTIMVFGCATEPAIKADFDSAHDFSSYKSFAWISENPMKVGKSVTPPKPTLQAAIMRAIRSNLETGGYRHDADRNSADYLVSFTVGSREKIDREAYPSMSSQQGGRWGWGTAYFGDASGASYTQGVLAIDMFDVAEQRPVWHGVAGRAISGDDRADMTDAIKEVVESILAGFPPNQADASE